MTVEYANRGICDRPAVALTFDDGPNPPRTEQVLDILAEYDAVATFFVIGKWAERWPGTLRRIVDAGHVVGNHSYSHTVGVGDYDAGEAAISHVTGRPCRFARAAAFDYSSCDQSTLITAKELLLVDADVNPADWDSTNAENIARAVLNHPNLGSGSIIDLHDGAEYDDPAALLGRPAAMINALPVILDDLQERRLACVGLDEFTFEQMHVWVPNRVDGTHQRAINVARSRRDV